MPERVAVLELVNETVGVTEGVLDGEGLRLRV